jgi:hypothetical protein
VLLICNSKIAASRKWISPANLLARHLLCRTWFGNNYVQNCLHWILFSVVYITHYFLWSIHLSEISVVHCFISCSELKNIWCAHQHPHTFNNGILVVSFCKHKRNWHLYSRHTEYRRRAVLLPRLACIPVCSGTAPSAGQREPHLISIWKASVEIFKYIKTVRWWWPGKHFLEITALCGNTGSQIYSQSQARCTIYQ